MLTNPSALDIAARLALAATAGMVVGYNREAHSEAAGLRTTTLVCMAACLSMVLANLLLLIGGDQQPRSFLRADVLRLPLGVLTGIGFIGAGAIIKRGDAVQGVTTAATIWFMTIVGLTLGAGELALGVCVTIGAVLVLWALKRIELFMHRDYGAALTVCADAGEFTEAELRRLIDSAKHRIVSWAVTYRDGGASYEVRAEVEWSGRKSDRASAPPLIEALAGRAGVRQADWSPHQVSA